MARTILVFGSGGMLGSYLVSWLGNQSIYHVVPIARAQYDAQFGSVATLVQLFKTYDVTAQTVVINALGMIPQASQHPDQAIRQYYQVNAIFPHVLATVCFQFGAHLIHASTDCVYNGMKGNYTETDPHDELHPYGLSKSLGEPSNCTVIRTSIVGLENRHMRSLLSWVQSQAGGTAKGWLNHHWNGITCLQYAKLVDHIIQNNLFWQGVRHIPSPDPVSKYELVQHINRIWNLNIQIRPHETAQTCDKTIKSIYPPIMVIPSIVTQLIELETYGYP